MTNWVKALEGLIRKYYAVPLHGKRLVWYSCFRCYTDGGFPVFRWIPGFHRMGYCPLWCLRGFWINWFGRCIYFSFGRDINGLYRGT